MWAKYCKEFQPGYLPKLLSRKVLKMSISEVTENIKVYGADWCAHTQETISYLDDQGVKYQYIDVEQDKKASDWVKKQNDGMEPICRIHSWHHYMP